MSEETYDANIRIRALPRAVDDVINAIATARQCSKWEVIRAALIAYAEKHRDER